MSKTNRQRRLELRGKIDAYFAERTKQGRFPTEAGMLLSLEMGEEEYERMRGEKLYSGEFERAKLCLLYTSPSPRDRG